MKTPADILVSIIVPMYNEEEYIETCLQALINQDYPHEKMEIIVVDSCSTDPSPKIVQKYSEQFSFIKIIYSKIKSTPATLNLGISQANGKTIFRIDAHSEPAKNFVSTCVEYLNTNQLGFVTGKLIREGKTTFSKIAAFAVSSRIGVGDSVLSSITKDTFIERGTNGAYWKDDLMALGLFDEKYVRGQDYDLFVRLRENGKNLLATPKTYIKYFARTSVVKLCKQYFWYGFYKLKIFKRHKKIINIRAVIPALFVAVNVALGIGGIFEILFLKLLIILLSVYLATLFSASVFYSVKHKKFALMILPVVFIILHLSHGAGFLSALLNFKKEHK